MQIVVKQTGKASTVQQLDEGTTLKSLLVDVLLIPEADLNKKTVTVENNSQPLTYVLKDMERVNITQNSAGAL